jgi:hypothetical protein
LLSTARGGSSSLYWRSWRDSPLEVHHDRPGRGADPPPALRAQGPHGAPDRSAEFEKMACDVFAPARGGPVEAAGAVDAQNAPTSSLENAQNAFSTATTGLTSFFILVNGTGAPRAQREVPSARFRFIMERAEEAEELDV